MARLIAWITANQSKTESPSAPREPWICNPSTPGDLLLSIRHESRGARRDAIIPISEGCVVDTGRFKRSKFATVTHGVDDAIAVDA